MPERPRVRRLWIPAAIIALFAVTTMAVMAWPDWETYQRAGTMVLMVVPVTLLLLTLWLLLLSGMRWYMRVAILAAVVLAEIALVRKIEFQGDMVPIVHFRSGEANEARLEAHRARQEKAGVAAE